MDVFEKDLKYLNSLEGKQDVDSFEVLGNFYGVPPDFLKEKRNKSGVEFFNYVYDLQQVKIKTYDESAQNLQANELGVTLDDAMKKYVKLVDDWKGDLPQEFFDMRLTLPRLLNLLHLYRTMAHVIQSTGEAGRMVITEAGLAFEANKQRKHSLDLREQALVDREKQLENESKEFYLHKNQLLAKLPELEKGYQNSILIKNAEMEASFLYIIQFVRALQLEQDVVKRAVQLMEADKLNNPTPIREEIASKAKSGDEDEEE